MTSFVTAWLAQAAMLVGEAWCVLQALAMFFYPPLKPKDRLRGSVLLPRAELGQDGRPLAAGDQPRCSR